MKLEGQSIWDTRIQGVTGVLTAQASHGAELFATATFNRLSDEPPRVIVSSNYKFPIDEAIVETGRFALNVMAPNDDCFVADLMKVRRREADKASVVRAQLSHGDNGVPFVASAQTVLLCKVEQDVAAGDRRLFVARVLEVCKQPNGARPLLFGEVLDRTTGSPKLKTLTRAIGNVTGIRDAAKQLLRRRTNNHAGTLAEKTYEVGGATQSEIEQVLKFGTVDMSRRLHPPRLPKPCRASLGICVVGTSWGALHCGWIRQVNPNARIYICGRDAERTARLARRVNASGVFSDMETAASDRRVECMTLALPHDLHKKAVEVAAAAGKHVLVEKPIATNMADARQMIATAESAGITFMVAENAHYRPAVHEAVRRIRNGDIGEPLYLLAHGGGPLRPAGWKRNKERMGGGVLMDIGVHYIRALRLLMGEPDYVSATRAMQINTKMEGEDSVQLVFSSTAGWEAHMLLSWATYRGALPDFVIAGDRGTLVLWPGKRYLDYYPVAATKITRLISMIRPYWLQAKFARPENQRVRVRVPGRDTSGYLGEVGEFLACVDEKRKPTSTPEDACRDLEIVLKAYEALSERRQIAIPA